MAVEAGESPEAVAERFIFRRSLNPPVSGDAGEASRSGARFLPLLHLQP
jgi:hypothetical protein